MTPLTAFFLAVCLIVIDISIRIYHESKDNQFSLSSMLIRTDTITASDLPVVVVVDPVRSSATPQTNTSNAVVLPNNTDSIETQQDRTPDSILRQREQSIASWANTTTPELLSLQTKISRLNCSTPENNHYQYFETCHCYNCCVKDKVVYVFDNNNNYYYNQSVVRWSNVTSRYMSATATFPIQHASFQQRRDFNDSLWVDTPVHYTSVKRQHILALWMWNADVWSTWHEEGWYDRDFGPFHWMLMNTISREDKDYLSTYWFALNHPSMEAPVRLNDNDDTHTAKASCYSHLMIGHHHTAQTLFASAVAKVPLGTNSVPPETINEHAWSLLKRYSQFFLEKAGLVDIATNPTRAVLISRKDSKNGRRILNEIELVSVMEEQGFEVEEIEFSELSFEESNRRIRSASVVFGSHGAGFTNIMVCHNSTAVIELHPFGFQKWGYAHLARILGLDYHYLNAPNTSYTKHSPASAKYTELSWNFYRHRDYFVDVGEFRAIIKKVKRQQELRRHV